MKAIVDTTVWVDFMRGMETPEVVALVGLVERRELVGITDVVLAELRAGSIPHEAQQMLDRMRSDGQILRLETLNDFEVAANCYKRARLHGSAVRSLTDCLIAAVCIREDLPLLHRDRDFATLAACTPLRVFAVSE